MLPNKTTGREVTEQQAPSRGVLHPQGGGGGGAMSWSRTAVFCACVSVLFWPKARKILAIAARNTMNFYFILLRECCLRGKSNKIEGGLLRSVPGFRGSRKDTGAGVARRRQDGPAPRGGSAALLRPK